MSHWSEGVCESVIRRDNDGALNIRIRGGAEDGTFPYFGPVESNKIKYESGVPIDEGNILLEVNGQTVAGLTLYDLNTIIASTEDPVQLKSVKETSGISKQLRQYLSQNVTRESVDYDLQSMIRDNLYLRTMPCTTRLPRENEVDGVDYRFLTKEEFEDLEKKGLLVEAGLYEGNFYGTPRPPKTPPDSPLIENWREPGQTQTEQNGKATSNLPDGWEIARTESGEVYFIDHLNEKTSWVHPDQLFDGKEPAIPEPMMFQAEPPPPHPSQKARSKERPNIHMSLEGEVIDVILCKGERGFGFTIIGGDEPGEFIQIKSIVAQGLTGVIPGDMLLRVNDEAVLGRPHRDVVKMFEHVAPGQTAALQLLRGYPLPADAEEDTQQNNIPTLETSASDSKNNHRSMPDLAKLTFSTHPSSTTRTISQPHLSLDLHNHHGMSSMHTISVPIVKGDRGFGFTVADAALGQIVKDIVQPLRCGSLQPDDLIAAINGEDVSHLSHDLLVGKLQSFKLGDEVTITIRRNNEPSPSSIASSAGALIPKNNQPFEALLSEYRQRALGEFEVVLHRQPTGFGFRILTGETGTPGASIGDIIPGGSAAHSGQMQRGDRLIAVDGHAVSGLSHSDVIQLMSKAARVGHVTLALRRDGINGSVTGSEPINGSSEPAQMRRYHSSSTFKNSEFSDHSREDMLTSSGVEFTTMRESVILQRQKDEGFGFIIMSSSRTIPRHRVGKVMIDSPAYRSKLRVGDRVLAVNDVSIDDLSHDNIVACIRKSGQTLRLLTIPVLKWRTPLTRTTGGFGFGLRGGLDHNLPFFILRLASDGPAAKSGELRVGDIVEEINNNPTDGLTHSEAIELIKSGGNHLVITLRRGDGTVPDLTGQNSRSGLITPSR